MIQTNPHITIVESPDDRVRQLIRLGVQMAVSEARRMLALKTQAALSSARRPPQSGREMEEMLDRYLLEGIKTARSPTDAEMAAMWDRDFLASIIEAGERRRLREASGLPMIPAPSTAP
jgi:hypothetical protein